MKCTNRERSKGRAWRLRRRSYKANFPCSCLPRYRRRERRPQKTLLALPSWQLQNYGASSPLCYMVKAVLPILQMGKRRLREVNRLAQCYMATQNTVNHIADSVASNAQLSHHLLCGFFFFLPARIVHFPLCPLFFQSSMSICNIVYKPISSCQKHFPHA